NQMIKEELKKAGVGIDNKGVFSASQMIEYRKIPVHRLITRINLEAFDLPAPLSTYKHQLDKVEISLKQHLGAPAVSIVKKGDCVEKGQIIATADGDQLGANIHSSIAGKVTDISKDSIRIES